MISDLLCVHNERINRVFDFNFSFGSYHIPSSLYLWTDWAWGGALPPPELPQFQLGGQMLVQADTSSQNITSKVHAIYIASKHLRATYVFITKWQTI